MLQYPLPPVPDLALRLTDLSPATHRQLCAVLNDKDHWRKVKATFDQLLNTENNTASGRQVAYIQNAEGLLTWFSNFNFTVEALAILLENSKLEEALHLLKNTDPVQITQQPTTENGPAFTVKSHGTLILFCSVIGFPLPSFQWFCDNRPLADQTSECLIIENYQTQHIGRYWCELKQQQRDGSTSTLCSEKVMVSLEHYSPFIVEEPPKVQEVHSGQPLELGCAADGYPDPNYQWYKDGRILPEKSKAQLKIDRACGSNTGFYSCCISNESGKIWTRETTVTVLESNPELRIIRQPCFPNNAPVQTGAQLLLSVEVSGAEPIRYQWYCNDIPLRGKELPALIWEAVPFEGNTKLKFRCRISNRYGDIDTDPASVSIDTTRSQQQHKASIKLALLIGNWSYRNMDELSKVENDVCTLHDILESRMEFKVVSMANLSHSEMRSAVDKFCDLVIPGAYVLVYFAGHGIYHPQCHVDYLLPVDVPSQAEYTVDNLIDKDEIIRKVQDKNPKLLVFLLDMCRKITDQYNNPRFYSTLPMAEKQPEPRSNLVIGFATSETRPAYENRSDENGIFMKFLKQEIEQRVRVNRMLESVQDRFRLENTGPVLMQIPQTTTTLAEDLTLHDPVDGLSIGNNLWNGVHLQLLEWQQMPQPQDATLFIGSMQTDVHIRFNKMSSRFLNGLQVEMTWMSRGHYVTNFEFLIEPASLRSTSVIQQGDAGQTSRWVITITNLQDLPSDKEALLIANIGSEGIRLPLGQPLIAKANLGSNNL